MNFGGSMGDALGEVFKGIAEQSKRDGSDRRVQFSFGSGRGRRDKGEHKAGWKGWVRRVFAWGWVVALFPLVGVFWLEHNGAAEWVGCDVEGVVLYQEKDRDDEFYGKYTLKFSSSDCGTVHYRVSDDEFYNSGFDWSAESVEYRFKDTRMEFLFGWLSQKSALDREGKLFGRFVSTARDYREGGVLSFSSGCGCDYGKMVCSVVCGQGV